MFCFGFYFSDAALYVVYTVPVALLLMCVLVIVYKYRCLKGIVTIIYTQRPLNSDVHEKLA